MRKGDLPAVVTRREAITATAGIGVAGFILGMKGSAGAKEQAGQLGSKVCVFTPEAVEGPFYFDPKLVRSDITERKRDAPLVLTIVDLKKESGFYLATLFHRHSPKLMRRC
jgi:hypothetical protein